MTPAQALRKLDRAFDDIFQVAEWQARRVLTEYGATADKIDAVLEAQRADLAKWRGEARKRFGVLIRHGCDLH